MTAQYTGRAAASIPWGSTDGCTAAYAEDTQTRNALMKGFGLRA